MDTKIEEVEGLNHMTETKDIRLIVRIKNNHLVKQREARGLNQSQMAEAIGISASAYGDIENLKEYPLNKNGDWNTHAKKISTFLKMTEEMVFPEAFQFIENTRVERELDAKELLLALHGSNAIQAKLPDFQFEKKELKEKLISMLSTLTEREQRILTLRFGLNGEEEHTYKEVGQILGGRSQSRMMAIEAKALRKLRHPSRTRFVREYA